MLAVGLELALLVVVEVEPELTLFVALDGGFDSLALFLDEKAHVFGFLLAALGEFLLRAIDLGLALSLKVLPKFGEMTGCCLAQLRLDGRADVGEKVDDGCRVVRGRCQRPSISEGR